MKREWAPGDVAMLITEGGERIGFRCGVPNNMGWQYSREPGQNTWSVDTSGYVKPIRPLVVLDPEDDATVDRVANAIRDHHRDQRVKVGVDWLSVRAALRSLAEPPPLTEEPTNYLAAVEDREGRVWVRDGEGLWRNHSSQGQYLVAKHWEDSATPLSQAAVRVLSEGIRP